MFLSGVWFHVDISFELVKQPALFSSVKCRYVRSLGDFDYLFSIVWMGNNMKYFQ